MATKRNGQGSKWRELSGISVFYLVVTTWAAANLQLYLFLCLHFRPPLPLSYLGGVAVPVLVLGALLLLSLRWRLESTPLLLCGATLSIALVWLSLFVLLTAANFAVYL